MRNLSLLFVLTFILQSCSPDSGPRNRGPIVFGDSSTIVTESDSRYLSDNIADFVPQTTKEEPVRDTIANAPSKADTMKTLPVATAPPVAEQAEPASGGGLEAPFKSFTVHIDGIRARAARNVNWNNAKGASFTLEDGELNNKRVRIKSSLVQKVQQRLQTVVLVKTPSGKEMKLTALPASNSTWETVKVNNGQFVISGLSKGQLKYNARFNPKTLQNAVQKLARSSRMSKKETDQLLRSVRNVRQPDQSPLSITLQSVTWKISAKDAAGKVAEKEIRIDINR